MNATGPTTIRLLPPLTVSADEVAEALRRVRARRGSSRTAQAGGFESEFPLSPMRG